MKFKILQRQKKARLGLLETPHGIVETPNFIPVGTQATVKAMPPSALHEIGIQIVLSNTYHLSLRPGTDLVKKMGGLHGFMGWDKPIMTDSGGFQVFSLGVGLASGESKVFKEEVSEFKPKQKPKLAQVEERGVTFWSHLDGSEHFLSPEISMRYQYELGADLIVAFDDHESVTHGYEGLLASQELTERWALRSIAALKQLKSQQLMYGVVHGALNKELRIRSAKFADKHFDAIAIGGIYGSRHDMNQILEWVVSNVSDEKIRHHLGIGEVVDLFHGVERGVDMFDCVAPMRRARNGSLYIQPQNGGSEANNFALNIRQTKYRADKQPIDPGCKCYTCSNFTRAYLAHLYRADEILFHYLSTYHNIYFMEHLMQEIKNSLKNSQFEKFKKVWLIK